MVFAEPSEIIFLRDKNNKQKPRDAITWSFPVSGLV